MVRTGFALTLLVFAMAPFARAEKLHLKDGNVLTGDFQRLLNGKIIFKTNSMGTLTIPAANVASFTSGSTVVVVLKGGERSDGILSVSEAGVWQLQSATGTTTLHASDVLAAYPFDVFMKENPAGPRKPWQDWKGQGALGYVLQQSSQRSRSLSINFTSSRVEPTLTGLPPHRATHLAFNMAFATVTQSSVTTKANTLTSVLREDFFIGGNARNYFFAQGQWDHIQPQELRLRQTYGGGLGRDVVRRANFTLSIQGGLTYVRTGFGTGELRNEMEALAGEKVTWTVLNHLSISHGFDVYPSLTSAGDYRFNSITALDAPISSRFSFNVSLNDQFLSRPVPGTQRNVLILSTGLGVNF
jgi:putative salt-induced outer membrane protein YdiY